MSQIYHISNPDEWAAAQDTGHYTAPSLEEEGFIHCSTLVQIVPVANAFYQDMQDTMLLCIEVENLESEVRWEAPAPPAKHKDGDDTLPGDLFPHIYGTVNLEAVVRTVELPRNEAGGYELPSDLL